MSNFYNISLSTSVSYRCPTSFGQSVQNISFLKKADIIFNHAKLLKYIRYSLLFLIFHFLLTIAHAQQDYKLIIHPVSGDSEVITSLNLQNIFKSKTGCIQYVNRLPAFLVIKGFASASVDSVWEDSVSVSVKLFTGGRYQWKQLVISDSNYALLNSLGYHPEKFNNQIFSQLKLEQLYSDVLDYYSSNGYPFAMVYPDSFSITDNKISARLNINAGSLYHIDSIMIEGGIHISKKFLTRYLGIFKHDNYSQLQLNKINQRLSLLSYVQQAQPWQVEMLNAGAVLHLYLKPARSNSINALVGLLPQSDQANGKLLFTGEAAIGLRNSFGSGETIGLNWQQLQPKSPQLNILYQQPYVFASPFGVNFNFQLYKRDSLYLNINGQAGIQYELSQHQSGAVIFQSSLSNVLSADTNLVKATRTLPLVADVSSTSIGLQYNYYNTDYRFNPRRGFEFVFTGSAGNKRIKKNTAITKIRDADFNGDALYDSIKLHSYQFRLQGLIAHYFALGKQSTFKLSTNAGLFQSPDYFQNELFRIGGFKLLRGFDEESIYTNRYIVGTAEYRYLIARNSWFYAFTDIGHATYNAGNVIYSHSYLSFGVGLSLETGAGVFSISLAEGKRNDTKLNFQQSKIHLGFISLF